MTVVSLNSARRRAATVGLVGLLATLLATLLGSPVLGTATAGPRTPDTALVSATPSPCTPVVHPKSERFAGTEADAVLTQVVSGTTVYVGGTFSSVTERTGCGALGRTLARSNIFAFDLSTGAVSDTFAPALDGVVRDVMMSMTGTLVYACGDFTTAAGGARRGLAKLTLAGALDPFDAHLSGDCYDTALAGGHLFVGGRFASPKAGLTVVTQTSGSRLTSYDTVNLTGTASSPTARSTVQKLGVSPNGQTLIVEGDFAAANGVTHRRALLISTGVSAMLDPWAAPILNYVCNSTTPSGLRVAAWSGDGTWFMLAGTGGAHVGTLCDAAGRFEFQPTNTAQAPTWVQYTGGDAILGGVVTGAAVYLGGHFEWADNPPIWPQIPGSPCNVTGHGFAGYNCKGPGAVDRQGIMAISPATGKALPWNPGRSRGIGARSLVIVPPSASSAGGLLVGSDGPNLGCATPVAGDCTGQRPSFVGGEGYLPAS